MAPSSGLSPPWGNLQFPFCPGPSLLNNEVHPQSVYKEKRIKELSSQRDWRSAWNLGEPLPDKTPQTELTNYTSSIKEKEHAGWIWDITRTKRLWAVYWNSNLAGCPALVSAQSGWVWQFGADFSLGTVSCPTQRGEVCLQGIQIHQVYNAWFPNQGTCTVCFRKAGELRCEPLCCLRGNDPPECIADRRHRPRVHRRFPQTMGWRTFIFRICAEFSTVGIHYICDSICFCHV